MNYDQLPADLRRKVDASLGSSPRKRNRKDVTGPGLPLHCTACGLDVGTSETAMTRHLKEVGHGRYEHRF